jgi:ABC-type sugar transport system permease subunit
MSKIGRSSPLLTRILRYPQLSVLLLLVGLASVTFVFPVAISMVRVGARVIVDNRTGDGWGLPVLRSTLFALITTVLVVSLALAVAILAKDCARGLHYGLVLLMLPMLMGAVSAAFSVKLDLLHSSAAVRLLADRSFLPTWGLMGLVQVWQLSTLATYLFWFRLQVLPTRVLHFARTSRLTPFEVARDVYWPHMRNLAAVLALFAAITSFYEYIKFHLILRASPGAGTELVSHWLLRFYSFYNSVDPRAGALRTLAIAGAGVILVTATALATVFVTLKVIDIGLRWLAAAGRQPAGSIHHVLPNVTAVTAILATAAPTLGLASYLKWGAFVPTREFGRSVALSFGASVIAVMASVIVGVAGRLVLRRTMERFDSRSAVVFALCFFVQVIPAIAIALCGYYWLSVLAENGGVARWVPVLWLACQVIIALPLTVSFVQVSHFRVRTSELDFQESSGVGLRDILFQSFLRRFALDYLLVGIFGFSIVWTEATVNATLSNLSKSIPSIAVELTQRVDGRGASYPEAAALIVTTMLPVILFLSLWNVDVRRRRLLTSVRSERGSGRK